MYRTVILPVVLYVCETWLLALSEECWLRVIENCMLRRIFGPKREELTQQCRGLHSEEPYALYSLSNIIWVISSGRLRWTGHVDGRVIFKWLFKKWDGGMDWIFLAEDRNRWQAPVNMVMNLWISQNAGIFLTS
jgi:hypothetical protein